MDEGEGDRAAGATGWRGERRGERDWGLMMERLDGMCRQDE